MTFALGVVVALAVEAVIARYLGIALCTILFLYCFAAHKKARKMQAFYLALSSINRDSVNRLRRNWDKLEGIDVAPSSTQCLYWKDLNISGKKSLLALFCRLSSPLGMHTLVSWFSGPACRSDITKRQTALQTLAPMLDWRQQVSAFSFNTVGSEPELQQLGLTIQNIARLISKKVLVNSRWAVALWSFVVVVMLVLIFLRVLPAEAFLAISGINLLILLCTRKFILSFYGSLAIDPKALSSLSELSEAIEKQTFNDSYLSSITQALRKRQHEQGFSTSLTVLNNLIRMSELRFNPIPYAIAQILFLWDLHIIMRLINWAKDHQEAFQDSLDQLGEFEAVMMLANLAFEHPDWTLPKVEDNRGQPVIMKNAGHPLFSQDKNVRNSLVVGKGAPITVITGSHMAGKTTCLRMVGCNSVLALAGSVVCADEMSMPMLNIATSIHVNDSLLDGVSLFMAEIIRIKQIVLQASQSNEHKGYKTLFLLDEVLRGANDVERKAVVIEVLKALAQHDVVGLVATNDLHIAQTKAIQHLVQHVHFQEQVVENEAQSVEANECGHSNITANLHYDYLLKPGIVTQTNALKLLKAMSIDIESSKKFNHHNPDDAYGLPQEINEVKNLPLR